MHVRSLRVDGRDYQISGVSESSWTIEVDYWLAVILLRDAAAWLQAKEIVLPEDSLGRVLIRHGRNTYSYLSRWGAWIICGPWRDYVQELAKQAIKTSGFLAYASVYTEWRYCTGLQLELVASLTPHICLEIPGWHRMASLRQERVRNEIKDLVLHFLEAYPTVEDNPDPAIPLDSYPGMADVPIALAVSEDASIRSIEIEAALHERQTPHLEALNYWWQSVFTMWWKGFW